MRIDLAEAGRTPGISQHLLLAERMGPLELGGEEIVLPEPVRAELTVTGSGGEFWVEGKVAAPGEFRCSRCLAPLRADVVAEFREKYCPAGTAQDDEAVFYQGEVIDVRAEVEKALLLAVPMKPVCRPDCRGICPKCGADLNEGPCGCGEEAADPRLAVLSSFFKDR